MAAILKIERIAMSQKPFDWFWWILYADAHWPTRHYGAEKSHFKNSKVADCRQFEQECCAIAKMTSRCA